MPVTEDTPDFVLENPYGNQGSNYTFEGDNLPLEGERADFDLPSPRAAHVDLGAGSAPGSGMLDYSSLFVSVVNAGGAIASTVGKGLPGPVAASKAAAAEQAAQQAPVRIAGPPSQAVPSVPRAATGASSTAATVAIGAGVLAAAGLAALAATRKRRP